MKMGDMIPVSGFSARARAVVLVMGLAAALSSACLTGLHRAKLEYSAGQEFARTSQTARAVAHWKRSLDEAEKACRRRPSAQAFTVKGLAEANLGRWREAEASFLQAFSFGFGPGETWASDSALAGLAASFEDVGLEAAALRIYAQVADRSDFRPALMVAAGRRTNLVLAQIADLEAGERARALATLGKSLDRLIDRDFACGLYHYLRAQVDAHLGDLRRSYEEAVMARELGLPTDKIGRDNDNQLVYCYVRLRDSVPPAEREALAAAQARWAAKWGWRDDRTPAWKKE
jgi:tetratricopeptide (TPR) repeat protein